MPRYFFDIENSEHYVDEDGTELANANEARVQAIIFAGDWLREHPESIGAGDRLNVAVRDESGTILLTVTTTAKDPADDRS